MNIVEVLYKPMDKNSLYDLYAVKILFPTGESDIVYLNTDRYDFEVAKSKFLEKHNVNEKEITELLEIHESMIRCDEIRSNDEG
jgi:hypothetical protein